MTEFNFELARFFVNKGGNVTVQDIKEAMIDADLDLDVKEGLAALVNEIDERHLAALAENDGYIYNKTAMRDYLKEVAAEGMNFDNIPAYVVIDWNATVDQMLEDFGLVEVGGMDFYYDIM